MSEGQVAVMDFMGVEKSSNAVAGMGKGSVVSASHGNGRQSLMSDFSLCSKYFREEAGNADNAATDGLIRPLEFGNGDGSCEKGNIMACAPSWMQVKPEMEKGKRAIPSININHLHLSSYPGRNSMELFPQYDHNKLGFGSPIPISGAELQCKNSAPANSNHDHDNILPQAIRQPHQWPYSSGCLPVRVVRDQNATGAFRCPTSTISGKQPSAQLTIFYGGTVNVYDDVPADKAQAIMLLADSCIAEGGNSWNSSFRNTAFPNCTSGNPSNINALAAILKPKSSQNTSIDTESPKPRSTISFPGGNQNPNPPTRKLQAGLPIARKRSLQRFVEKRKDRLNSITKIPCSTTPSAPVSDRASPPSLYRHQFNENSQYSSSSFSK